MNWHALVVSHGAEVIDRLTDDVHHAAECAAADGNRDGATLVNGFHAANHTVGGLHGDTAHAPFAEVLLHFENDVDRRRDGEAVADDAKRLVDGRHRRLDELHVDGGAGDLNDVSDIFWHKNLSFRRD